MPKTATNASGQQYDPNDPLDPNNPNNPKTGTPWVTPPADLPTGSAWGDAGASPLTNLGYFTNEPGILGRTLMRGGPDNTGPYAKNVYAQDPFSQYLQNRYQAAGTLGTYLAPANDFNGQTQFNNAAGFVNAINDPFAAGGAMAQIRNLLPYFDKFNAGQVGSTTSDPGMFAGPNAAQATAALSLWKDPQADIRLLQSALAGLPTPLSNALGSMSSTLYQMFQDQLPSLPKGMQFLPWLMGG